MNIILYVKSNDIFHLKQAKRIVHNLYIILLVPKIELIIIETILNMTIPVVDVTPRS